MRRDMVDVDVTAFEGAGPPVLFELAVQPAGPRIWLYQRDDAAWLPVFPADRDAIARPRTRGGIDVPGIVASMFPELIR